LCGSGGGLSPDGTQWISCRAGFFLPVRVLSRLFRRLFLEQLVKAYDAGKLEFISSMESLQDWPSFLEPSPEKLQKKVRLKQGLLKAFASPESCKHNHFRGRYHSRPTNGRLSCRSVLPNLPM
jgi:hypothetical protein